MKRDSLHAVSYIGTHAGYEITWKNMLPVLLLLLQQQRKIVFFVQLGYFVERYFNCYFRDYLKYDNGKYKLAI